MILTRRRFLATSAAAVSAQSAQKPNVLVFMSDQESALLPGPAKLPNRQRLLARGTQYTNAFCNTPQCSPARAALITGFEPHKVDVLTNVDAASLGKPLPHDVNTIERSLRLNGYSATGYFGKWHLGGDRDGLAKFGYNKSLTRGSDEEIVAAAADWIGEQKTPWHAWVSVLDPHHIYDAPRNLSRIKPRDGVKPPVTDASNLKTKPPEQQWFLDADQGRVTRDWKAGDWIRYRTYYLELVEKVDALLGKILAQVDLNNTIVVYTSDHGDALGEHGLPFKGPFMYEELIRIPFIVAVPGQSARRSTNLVTQAHLRGMLHRALGIAKGEPPVEEVFLEYYAKQKQVNPIRTVRSRQWKLNAYDSGSAELYNLAVDPHETTNLANETRHRATKSHLQAKLDSWRAPLRKRMNE